jgi:hypothetical protein
MNPVERAKNGTRTRDPNLGKVMLYQLSYFRILNYSAIFAKHKKHHFHVLKAGANIDIFFYLLKFFVKKSGKNHLNFLSRLS